MTNNAALKAVFFDLDGTLIDTAPDLCGTIQDMQKDRGADVTPFEAMEHLSSGGARALLGIGFGLEPGQDEFAKMRLEFLERYEARIAQASFIYAGMEDVLALLEARGLAWGVVTNKPYYLADKLMRELNLFERCAVLIGGDTAEKPKPSPLPCLLASEKVGVAPELSLMVGDDARDIVSGKAAGMRTAAVAYGYIASPIEQWGADFVFSTTKDLHQWLEIGRFDPI
ncbi:MAG: HAD-IA family hydrolase [Limnobacter sp.]|nr:HAD-IA family hydrolase [Limnobacter sp.]